MSRSPPLSRRKNDQYVIGKLHLEEAHKVATGKDVLIAVIDSAIDVKHPDLSGSIAEEYDAVGRVRATAAAWDRDGRRHHRASAADGNCTRRKNSGDPCFLGHRAIAAGNHPEHSCRASIGRSKRVLASST